MEARVHALLSNCGEVILYKMKLSIGICEVVTWGMHEVARWIVVWKFALATGQPTCNLNKEPKPSPITLREIVIHVKSRLNPGLIR